MLLRSFPRLKGRGRIEAGHTADRSSGHTLEFPRLKGRGRIEACKQPATQTMNLMFPRLKGRGRIEAR